MAEVTAADVRKEVSGYIYTICTEPEQWRQLEQIFIDNGSVAPDPRVALPVIAVDMATGQVDGMICLQLVYHAEPVWIREGKRDKVSFTVMAKLLDEVFVKSENGGQYYVFTTDAQQEAMATAHGMKKLSWSIWTKEL